MWYIPSQSTVVSAPRQIKIGNVVYPKELFTLWTDQQRADVGVLPLTDNVPTYNARTQTLGEPVYTVVGNAVTQTRPVIARPLADVKADAMSEANAWRLTKEQGGFTYASKTWQSDTLSAQRIMGAAILAGSNPFYSQEWTAADNSVVTLDQAGMQGLFGALGTHVATTFATAKAAKAAINAATTIEQIEAALATLI